MSDVGLNIELWTMPNSGDFHRRADITRYVVDRNLDTRFADLDAGTLVVSNACPYIDQFIKVDKANHANDVASTIMVFRDGVWLRAFVIVERETPRSAVDAVSTFALEDLWWLFDRAKVYAFDHPADPIREGDWLYGAPSILPQAGESVSNERYEIFRSSLVSSGTFRLGNGTDETGDIPWNATKDQLTTAIETNITAITSVAVAGDGSALYPWQIEVLDPAGTQVADLTITLNSTNGNLSMDTIRDGGTPSPLPWHGTVDATTNVRVGNYEEFEMVEAGVGGVPAAPPGSTSTYLLKLNPDVARDAGDYAGVQVEPSPEPLVRHRAYIDVISPTSPQRVRFVIRDINEETLAWIETTVSTSWVRLTAVDVDGTPYTEFPEGLDVVVYRVGVIEEDNADPIFIDVNGALLAPGADASELGIIYSDLLAPMNTRGVLDWVVPTYTDTLDSAGVAWPRAEAWGIEHGQSMYQVIEFARDWGYEHELIFNGGRVTPFNFNAYGKGNAGTNYTGQGGPTINTIDGTIEAGATIVRAPDFTTAIAEGTDGRWAEHTDAVLSTGWGRLEGYYRNPQGRDSTLLGDLAIELVANEANETTGAKVSVVDPSNTPLDTIKLGDVVPVILLDITGATVTQSMRVVGVTISQGAGSTKPRYDYHLDAMVFDPDTAEADAMRSLIRRFETLGARIDTGGSRSLDVAATRPFKVPWVVASNTAPQVWKDIAGYQCDGVDDQVEIQACLDTYQLAHLSPGGFVTDTGDSVTPAITIPTGARLQGSGYQETFLENEPSTATQPTAQTVAVKCGLYSTLADIYVGNSFWDGGVAVATGYGSLIERLWAEVWQDFQATALLGSAGDDLVTLRDCRLVARNSGSRTSVDNESYGLRIDATGLDRWTIDNCDIEGGTYAVKIDAADTMFNLQVHNSRIGFGSGWDAIWMNGDRAGYFGSISGCHFRSYGGSAATADFAAAIRITGTGIGTISDSDTADTPLTISDCSAEGSGICGVVVIGRAGGRVVDCYFEGLTLGVLLDDASEWRVLDSDFFWCGDAAAGADTPMIRLTNATSRARVMGCTLRTEQGNTAVHPDYGIEVATADCTDNRILHNDLEQLTGEEFVVAPILDSGTGTIFAIPTDPTWGDNLV